MKPVSTNLRALACASALVLSGLALPARAATVDEAAFGAMSSGEPVKVFTLRNGHGIRVRVLTYGGTLQSIEVPDRDGHVQDIVLGFGDLQHYLKDVPAGNLYFGALIGRYANRIAYGRFALDGQEHQVPVNMPPHALHGGTQGFDKRLWSVVSTSTDARGAHLTLGLVSPDGDQGFPGTLHVTVEYTLDDRDSLTLRFRATTDRPTVVSLTSHSFWNLGGEGSGSIENDFIRINAARFTPADATGIPTGELRSVAGTPFDLRRPTRIGAHLRDDDPQLDMTHGYDENFVIDGPAGAAPRLAATLYSPASGRRMEILTTQPGLQFYTSNGLDGRYRGLSGKAYRQTDAVALEAEAFPDSPNHPTFPSVVLRPGHAYDETTIFHFAIGPDGAPGGGK